MKVKLPEVAIVGRANVGKSTLFNCLIEKNKAIISNIAGTTRDRNIDVVKWRDREFTLIDTGGLDVNRRGGIIEINIVKQAQKAIATADLVLFLIDVKVGVLATDRELARELVKKNLKKKTILIGNKADSIKWRQMSGELYKLNLGEPIMVSALSGSGTGDLLDLIIEKLPKKDYGLRVTDYGLQPIKIAIVGKPNVGKSSLLNAILGEERVIVTDIPHTTRESHDAEFIYQENRFILVDTAGIIKKGKIVPGSLEKKSIDKSIETIGGADVVIFITEVDKRISTLDKKITQEILASSKPVIIVANKWDLIPEKDTNTVNKYVDYYRAHFPYLSWAPIIFISAKSGQRARKILDLVLEIKKLSAIQISDSQLQKFLKSQIKQHKPSRGKGLKNPYIYEIRQTGSNPPRFIISVNDPATLHFSYIRFLQNGLREKFKIIGTPIQIETKRWIKTK